VVFYNHRRSMATDIPNNTYSNLIQIPVFLACTIVLACVKRRITGDDRRDNATFRFDIIRQMCVTMCAISTMIAIAIVFEGNSILNLLVIVAVDMVIGTAFDIGMLKSMHIGGMKIGCYGEPPQTVIAIWHTAVTVTISITARCTSAIAAIFMFPYANKNAEYFNSVQLDGQVVIVGLPALYCVFRTIVLDQFYRFSQQYQQLEHNAKIQIQPQQQFAIESDEEVHSPKTTDTASPTSNTDTDAHNNP